MANTTVAARIAALVRQHAPHNAKIENLEKDVADIAAAAVASARGFDDAVSASVTLEWFKLANRAEIKLTADTTTALSLALVSRRGQRVILTFADPDMVVGLVPARQVTVAEQPAQLDLEDAIDGNEEMTGASREVVDPKTGEITLEQTAEPRRLVPRGAPADDKDGNGKTPDGEMPDLPKALRRGKKAEPKAAPQAEAAKPAASEPVQWVTASVDEPDSEDAGAP